MAYALNITLVPNGQDVGYITVFPTGQTQPTVSTMNSYDGTTKANAVVVGAGTNQGVTIYSTDTTDLVIDISGYWVAPGVEEGALEWFPMTQCRVVDTTLPNGALGGPAVSGGSSRDFPIQSTTNCNIPTSATAYGVNVTATPPNGAPIGYVTVWPTSQAQPGTSTLNSPTGTTVSNMALVDAGGTGSISVYSSDDTNIAIDINGYFAPAGGGGEALYTIAPCRLYDSRTQNGVFTGTIDSPVITNPACVGLPQFITGTQTYVLNATVLPEGGLGFLTVYGQTTVPPQFSDLYALNSQVTSNMALTYSFNGFVSAFAGSPTNLILDLFGYFDSPLLRIVNPVPGSTLTPALQNQTFTPVTVSAQGGVPPYTWDDHLATLPPGLTIATATGVISGCPTAAGTFNPDIFVTDSVPTTADAIYTLVVNPMVALAFPTQALPDGQRGNTYPPQTLAATTGTGVPPYTYSLVSGTLFTTLPPGLTLSSGGVISGVVQQNAGIGVYTFMVKVTDSECQTGGPGTVTTTFTINVPF